MSPEAKYSQGCRLVMCHGVSWHIATVSGKIPVFGIRGISGDIPEETKRDRPDWRHVDTMNKGTDTRDTSSVLGKNLYMVATS